MVIGRAKKVGKWAIYGLAVLAVITVMAAGIRMAVFPKVGVVDTPVLLSQFSLAIEAQEELQNARTEWDRNARALADSVKAAIAEMKENYEGAARDDQEQMEEKLSKWNRESARYNRAISSMASRKEEEVLGPVLDKVNEFIDIWARRNGYDLVVGSGAGGIVLSRDQRLDVTARLITDLNRMYETATKKKNGTRADSLENTRDNADIPQGGKVHENK